MLKTRLTERLGIELPFVLAPMGPYANGELAAAVSNAGGLGTIGAWPTMGVNEAHVRREIGVIRDRTDRPFGAGFATHHIATGRANFDAVLEEGVPVVLLSFDDPTPWVPLIHEAGATVICQVQSHEAARQAVEAGADVICIQGNEAGGHTGTQNLLPALVRALDSFGGIPIIAAGGITGGRALAAVLAAGCDGAWLGTALLAANEATFDPELAKAIVASDGTDTVYAETYDAVASHLFRRNWVPWPAGIAWRHRRTPFIDRWRGHAAELLNDPRAVAEAAQHITDLTGPLFPKSYGEGAGAVATTAPAAEIMQSMLEDAVQRLKAFQTR